MSGIVESAVPKPRSRFPRWQLLAAGALAIALLASPAWGPPLLRRFAFFHVRKIEVLGAKYTPVNDVLARLSVDTNRSVWDPLGPLMERVSQHPQIAHVIITRKLPATLVVAITERRPVALVPSPDGLQAVDETGRRLPLDPSRTPVDAPVVTTTPHDTAVFHLLGGMQRTAPRIYSQLSTINRGGPDEIVLRIAGMEVRAMTSVSLARLSDIDPVERDLARRQIHAVELDLRYRDQVIARLP